MEKFIHDLVIDGVCHTLHYESDEPDRDLSINRWFDFVNDFIDIHVYRQKSIKTDRALAFEEEWREYIEAAVEEQEADVSHPARYCAPGGYLTETGWRRNEEPACFLSSEEMSDLA